MAQRKGLSRIICRGFRTGIEPGTVPRILNPLHHHATSGRERDLGSRRAWYRRSFWRPTDRWRRRVGRGAPPSESVFPVVPAAAGKGRPWHMSGSINMKSVLVTRMNRHPQALQRALVTGTPGAGGQMHRGARGTQTQRPIRHRDIIIAEERRGHDKGHSRESRTSGSSQFPEVEISVPRNISLMRSRRKRILRPRPLRGTTPSTRSHLERKT